MGRTIAVGISRFVTDILHRDGDVDGSGGRRQLTAKRASFQQQQLPGLGEIPKRPGGGIFDF